MAATTGFGESLKELNTNERDVQSTVKIAGTTAVSQELHPPAS